MLLEDTGALIGLVLRADRCRVDVLTGDPFWDGIGTICIGLLLGVIAVILIIEMHSLLIGEGATNEQEQALRAALENTAVVDRVIHLRTQYLSPDEMLVGAKIALPPDCDLATVARVIDDAEARMREAVPATRVIYLEPDVDREPTT